MPRATHRPSEALEALKGRPRDSSEVAQCLSPREARLCPAAPARNPWLSALCPAWPEAPQAWQASALLYSTGQPSGSRTAAHSHLTLCASPAEQVPAPGLVSVPTSTRTLANIWRMSLLSAEPWFPWVLTSCISVTRPRPSIPEGKNLVEASLLLLQAGLQAAPT